jgi:hypothetical protein
MALLQYTVMMTGSAVRATTVKTPISFLRIENEASNADVKYGTSAVAAADYGGTIKDEEAAVEHAVEIGPFPTACMDLSDIYFLGTNTQKIHLTAVTP